MIHDSAAPSWYRELVDQPLIKVRMHMKANGGFNLCSGVTSCANSIGVKFIANSGNSLLSLAMKICSRWSSWKQHLRCSYANFWIGFGAVDVVMESSAVTLSRAMSARSDPEEAPMIPARNMHNGCESKKKDAVYRSPARAMKHGSR